MELIQNAEGWLFKVAAKKAIVKIVSLVLAWLASGVIQGYMTQWGVTVDPVTLQASLTGTLMTGLKMVEDWVNLKYGTNL